MPGDDLGPDLGPDPTARQAADRWNALVADRRSDLVPVPPLADDPAVRSIRWAQEVLPPVGGTVLDIGCGAGAAALALVPPATEIIGVDPVGALLDEFVAAAVSRDVARRTVHGAWPDVVATTPTADVAICRHVVQSIGDIAPFLLTLTDRARLAVVAELTVEHPTPPMRSVASALGVDLASGDDGRSAVRAADLLPVLAELGCAPESTTDERTIATGDDLVHCAPSVGRWLGLGDDRLDDIERALGEHAAGRSIEVLALRWPGAADPSR